MIDIQDLEANLVNRDFSLAFRVNQHDKGIKYKVNLFNADNTKYTLSEDETVTIEWRKPNCKPYLQTTDITKGTDYIEFAIKEAITQFAGIGSFNIIIKKDGYRKGTIKREYEVVETAMGYKLISEDVLDNAIVDLLDDVYAEVKNLKDRFNEHVKNHPGGSGGGGGGYATATIISSLEKLNYKTGENVIIPIFFTSPNSGDGKLYVMLNDIETLTQTVSMGDNSITLTDITKGSYTLSYYVVDSAGVYSNKISYKINIGSLEINSSFNFDKDYQTSATIRVPLTISTVSNESIVITYKLGSYMYTTEGVSGYNSITLPSLSAGVYKVEIVATSGEFTSNTITGNLVLLAGDELFVSTTTANNTSYEEGELVTIDYRISMKNTTDFNVTVKLDDADYKVLAVKSGTNYLTLTDLAIGTHIISFVVSDQASTQTFTLNVCIIITESSFEAVNPITAGLVCWFDAKGKNNDDVNKNTWEDKSGNNTIVTLTGINYKTNGWIDNTLQLDGSSYAEIDVTPFADNVEYGCTIDILYKVDNTGDETPRLIECISQTTSAMGIYADVNEISLKSISQSRTTPHTFGEKTRATWVIDRDRKLAQIYINGVISETMILTDTTSSLENFQHSGKILLNTNYSFSSFGKCNIYNLRVYDRPLTHEEVLQNHIADLTTRKEQQEKYNFNFAETMPTMYLYGDTTSMTKDNPVPMRIKYISTDTDKYGQSFDLDGSKSTVGWQGTSSLQYAIKNYKLKLKDNDGNKYKHIIKPGVPETSTFCLKADYMESSHANNTGIASFVNDCVYDTLNPPQQDNAEVRTSIAGFPIKLYINDTLMGVFNFNLDKGSKECYGMTSDYPDCISIEVAANTDSTAGAFHKWTEDSGKTLIEYYTSDFEIRYAENEDDPTIWDTVHTLVSWVNDASDETFAAELEQHFNKEYLIKYYLVVMVFGMVDNLGKNMMLNTWDRNIWYPNFYDNDTALGLDNSGFMRIDSDCEIEAGTFNTSQSLLWTKLARVFDADIKAMYKSMRSNQFRLEKMYEYFISNQIEKIPERMYNLDAEVKYIPYGREYAHMLHGSRKEHMKKWLKERILYLDSLLGYDEQTANYITIRANKQGTVSLRIQTYSPIYFTVKWRNGELETKKIGRDKTVTFSTTIPTATDQEIILYAAQEIKTIDGISNLNPTALMLSNATRLTKLICTSAKALLNVSVDNNTYLKTINLNGCTALGTSTNTTLDVSNCPNLTYLNVNGTALTNVIFNVSGSNIETFCLSSSLKSAELINMPNLKTVTAPTSGGIKISNLKIVDFDESSKAAITKFISTTYIENLVLTNVYLDTLNLGSCGNLTSVRITNSTIIDFTYSDKDITSFSDYYIDDSKFVNVTYLTTTIHTGTVLDISSKSFKKVDINIKTGTYKQVLLPTTIESFKLTKNNNGSIDEFPFSAYFPSLSEHDESYLGMDFSNKKLNDVEIYEKCLPSEIIGINFKQISNIVSLFNIPMSGTIDYSMYIANKLECMYKNYCSINGYYNDLTIVPITAAADDFQYGGTTYMFYNCDMLTLDEVKNILTTINLDRDCFKSDSMFAYTNYNPGEILRMFTANTTTSFQSGFKGNTFTGDIGTITMNSNIYYVDQIFKECSFSKCKIAFNNQGWISKGFADCTNLTDVEVTIGSRTSDIDCLFSGDTALKNAKLIFASTWSDDATDLFKDCNNLESLIIEGTVDCNITKTIPTKVSLTAESITSIVNALADRSSTTSGEISLAKIGANITEESITTLTAKNWNII